ncbi:MAG: hypothetical protein AAB605_04260 [Patescibacteria group bacterium]
MFRESLTTLRLVVAAFAIGSAVGAVQIVRALMQGMPGDAGIFLSLITGIFYAGALGYLALMLPSLLPRKRIVAVRLLMGVLVVGILETLYSAAFLSYQATQGRYAALFVPNYPFFDIAIIAGGSIAFSAVITWILVSSINRLSRPEPLRYDWRFQILAWGVLLLIAGTLIGIILSMSEIVL